MARDSRGLAALANCVGAGRAVSFLFGSLFWIEQALSAAYVGAGLGLVESTWRPFSSGLLGEIQAGASFGDHASLGVEVGYARRTQVDVKATLLPMSLIARYHFDTFSDGAYVGLGTSIVQASRQVLELKPESSYDLGVGAQAGYQFEVANGFAFGPRVSALHVFSGEGLQVFQAVFQTSVRF